MSVKVTIPNVRLSFPYLYKKNKPFEEGQEPKYTGQFIMQEDSIGHKRFIEALEAVKLEKWGKKVPAKCKSPLHDGADKTDRDGEIVDGYGPGTWFFNASRATRPSIYDNDPDKTPLTEADGRPYAGCYVDVSIDLWAQDDKRRVGVNCALRGVRFRKDGERFGGGATAADDEFEDEIDLEETEDDVYA